MKHFILYISALLLLCSCSTRKDKFLNRQYHALITKYNVLYNGKLAFEKGLDQVEKTYEDDFSEVLPIEPFSFYADQQTDGDAKSIGQGDFERAEEKAVKAIQKHSMLIRGSERNPQTDEAYLLMAKSRYYTKRFGPALESFQYIIRNYPRASLIYETVVWRAKANIHIGNAEFGKKALERLLGSPKLSPEIRQQAELGVVMAYEKTPDSLDQIAEHLEASLKAFSKGSAASRAAFVLGQVYQKKEMIEESDKAFDKAINMRKGLYKFKINSKLEKINNHLEDYTTEQFLDEVNHLIKVTKNRKYLGKLLYEKALIYEAVDSLKLAKKYYTESVHNGRTELQQKVLSYEKLGDLSYNIKDYSEAKSYYDSLIDISQNKNSRRFIRIKRKSSSLNKIVGTLKEATANDSLIKIAGMSDADLDTFFEDYIKKLKEREKQARLKELRLLANQNKPSGFDTETDWYFYNRLERVKGKNAFKELWGVLAKKENWQVSALGRNKSVEEAVDSLKTKELKVNDKYKVTYYKSKVNKEPKFLDSIAKRRNLNYYELGNAYFSQLSEKELAIEKLEELLSFNPSKDLKTGAYYRLHKIYNQFEDVEKANTYKQKLVSEFPNSSFTKLVINDGTEGIVGGDVDDYITCYETIYDLYILDSLEAAKEEMEQALLNYGESALAAKYALLNAYIFAKEKGKETFHKMLKDVKFRYPNTDEAKKAEEILNSNIKK